MFMSARWRPQPASGDGVSGVSEVLEDTIRTLAPSLVRHWAVKR